MLLKAAGATTAPVPAAPLPWTVAAAASTASRASLSIPRPEPICSTGWHPLPPYVRSPDTGSTPTESPLAKQLAHASLRALHPLRFLVVDDVMSNRKLLVHLLRRRYPTSTFAEVVNGKEAVDVFAASATEPAYDVALMDGSMPIMDGQAATRLLRRRFDARKLLVLACTGNALEEE